MKQAFRGGVRLAMKKEACGTEIKEMQAPRILRVPLRQHIGPVCRANVARGDRVKTGEMIGAAQDGGVPVHSPVSGTVLDIRECGTAGGCVEIENDGQGERVLIPPLRENADVQDVIGRIHMAGIVGMGGAAFPAAEKMKSGAGRTDTLIVNACECEPYICADAALIVRWPERVLGGMQILARTLGARRMIVALEEYASFVQAALRREIGCVPGAGILVLPAKYPQGAEKMLVLAATGRFIGNGMLPADAGCAVFNASTCAAVWQAVQGEPLLRRVVSVTGEGIARPANVLAPIGTPVSALIEECGGMEKDGCLIAGGPMMGREISLDEPFVKAMNAILVLQKVDRATPENHCIRCGACVRACPMHIVPLLLYRAAQENDKNAQGRLQLADCIGCGCCSYICPQRLPLSETFRRAKAGERGKG